MAHPAWRVASMAVLALAVLSMLPSHAKPAPKPRPAEVVLPSWAPKSPSKEFLRAAKVLKPIPEEAQPYDPIYLGAWELFGSMTEEQTQTFVRRTRVSIAIKRVSPEMQEMNRRMYGAHRVGDDFVYDKHEVRVPVKSFAARQRALLQAMAKAGTGGEEQTQGGDLFVALYKLGAKRDLSNVTMQFSVTGGHAVMLDFLIAIPRRARDGTRYTDTAGYDTWVAQFQER